ncbi:MAG: hypothetical protein AAB650_01355 [Patescibacteria group bacterium]
MAEIERLYALRPPKKLQVRRQVDFISRLLGEFSVGPEIWNEDFLGGMNSFRRRIAIQEFQPLERELKEFANCLEQSANRIRFEVARARQKITIR